VGVRKTASQCLRPGFKRKMYETEEFNPLSPNSDKNEISLYIFNACSNTEVMRIKKVIPKDKMS